MERKNEHQRDLDVELDEAMTVTLCSEMAEKVVRAHELTQELKDFTDGHRGNIKSLAARIQEISRQLQSGRMRATIVCEEQWDYSAGKVWTVRTDTGAVVSERAMTADERQRTIFEQDGGVEEAEHEEVEPLTRALIEGPKSGDGDAG